MEETVYTVVINGKPSGPYPLSALRNLGLKPDTFVRRLGMDDYKEAHELPELRELFGFVYRQTAPQYFASFDQRVVACVIDYLVVLGCYLVLTLTSYLVLDQMSFTIFGLIGLVFLPTVKLIYGSIAEASIKQATIGKRLMDIKVTDLNGSKIDLKNSFGRNFGKIISNLTLCFGYLYLFLNKRQQCLHDVMAETLVIKQRLI